MTKAHTHLDHDWYGGGIPGNVVIGSDVFVDTSHCFEAFHSSEEPGLILGEASGVYDRTAFVVGPRGRITVGPFTCLNATYLICNHQVTIGAHCLLAWGSVITDTWLNGRTPLEARRRVLEDAALNPDRWIPPVEKPRPVVLEDNVWVGFDAVILPGVRLGRGCVIGCRTIINEDVPPYAVVVGDPPRVIRYMEPDDTDEARAEAFKEYLHRG